MPLHQNNKLIAETIVWDILESVTDAVVTIDESHRVIFCNRAAEAMFGYPCEEIVGRDVSPLIPHPHHDLHQGYVERYITTGIPRVIGRARECIGQRRDGATFPVEISYSVSRTAGHSYFTAVIRDITQRKEMERELRFMEKLADIGKAVAHVAHEIRKPLTLIGGFARQVERSEALSCAEKDRHKLGIIVEEVRRLETLLNGIRLLTRPPASSEKRPVRIHALLQETFELLEPMIKDRPITFEVALADDPCTIQGDPDQLKQVFLNLLQNSIDVLDGAGTVRVSSQICAGRVRILFEDTGPGIPQSLCEKIFDPFFTTKPDGTGLGLAISRNILHDHGGSLTLRSSTPQGSTFLIELPLQPV